MTRLVHWQVTHVRSISCLFTDRLYNVHLCSVDVSLFRTEIANVIIFSRYNTAVYIYSTVTYCDLRRVSEFWRIL